MSEQEPSPGIQQPQESISYSEQEIVAYSRLEVQVIHHLCDAGILRSIEGSGQERRYRAEDLLLLRRTRRLQQDLGVNLEGIEIIVRLTERVEELQRELAHYQRLLTQIQQKNEERT